MDLLHAPAQNHGQPRPHRQLALRERTQAAEGRVRHLRPGRHHRLRRAEADDARHARVRVLRSVTERIDAVRQQQPRLAADCDPAAAEGEQGRHGQDDRTDTHPNADGSAR